MRAFIARFTITDNKRLIVVDSDGKTGLVFDCTMGAIRFVNSGQCELLENRKIAVNQMEYDNAEEIFFDGTRH